MRSAAYEKAIKQCDPGISVLSIPCTLFVPIVEEGLEDDRIAELMAKRYLEAVKGSDIDTLVMGCTHYPILERTIRQVVGKRVTIVNTGRETAKDVLAALEKEGVVNHAGRGGSQYFVTDSPDTFKEVGSRFLGEEIKQITFLKSLDYKDFLPSS